MTLNEFKFSSKSYVVNLHVISIVRRIGHDQVFSLYAPIPIFQKNNFSDPIIDQILDTNYDQIPIIDPIKNKRHLPKKKKNIFCKW